MSKHLKAILGQLVEESPLTLDELSRAVYTDVKIIALLVDYQISELLASKEVSFQY